MELDDETIERIARRVAELLRDTPSAQPEAPVRLVDAVALAERIGVRREWVYRHAKQLGAVRLGGPRGRLRFDLDVALRKRGSDPKAGESDGSDSSGRSGLGFADCSTYSRKGSTKSGRAARQRPRPDTGNREHPMQSHRSAKQGGRR